MCSTDVVSVTSHVNACACPPAARISAMRSSSASALRANANTVAPRSATAIAEARPIPLDAPVMIDVLADQRPGRVVAPGPVGIQVLGPVPPQLRRVRRELRNRYPGAAQRFPRCSSAVKVGVRSTTSRISAGMPSCVAAMLRSTLARPVARRNGVAAAPGSDPRSGGRPAASATPR